MHRIRTVALVVVAALAGGGAVVAAQPANVSTNLAGGQNDVVRCATLGENWTGPNVFPHVVHCPPAHVPPTTTTTTAPATACTSANNGGFGAFPPTPALITMGNGYDTYIGQDMWAANGTGQNGATSPTVQTMCDVNGFSDWTVTANMQPPDYTGVQTYPNVQQLVNNWNGDGWNNCGSTCGDTPIDSLASLTGSWSTVEPALTDGDWELAYDIWTTAGKELMVWVDPSNQRADNGDFIMDYQGVPQENVTVGGQTFTLYNYGGTQDDPSTGLPQLTLTTQVNGQPTYQHAATGSVNLLAVFKYFESVGVIPVGQTLSQIDFGWEICNSGGAAETFTLNGYTLLGAGLSSEGKTRHPPAPPAR